MATKKKLIDAYRAELESRYTWAKDQSKLDRFMKSVEATLTGPENSWTRDGAAYKAALKSCGLPRAPSLTLLRELPAE